MSDPHSLLGDDDPDDYPTDTFRVNKDFSGKYDVWRQKEEMAKLKALKSNMSDSSSESESEEEPVIEKDFLKALSLLKSDDPKIYSKAIELFKDEGEVKKKPKTKKDKPMFMKDFERELVLKRNGEFSEDEEEPRMTLAEEEEQERKVFMGDSSDDDEEEDTLREKSEMKTKEDSSEADYLTWLKGQKEDVGEDVREMTFLQKFWNDPKLDKDEKFLRDYILDEKFVVRDKSEVYLTNDDEEIADAATLSDDEEIVQKQEQFEHKYNFRFEEPDTEFIKRYPRTIGDSLRREDTKRKIKREDYAERKKKEKDQKREELKRLKALKRKEIEEKFLKLKEISGQEELNFDEEDIESDFDPDKHDRKMKELFNDDYYTVEEEQKPEFEYDEELDDEKWDQWTRNQDEDNKTSQSGGEEEEESEDEKTHKLSAKEEFEQEMIDSSRVGKKRGKKKSLFAKIISQPKPIYDPEGKSFDDYLEEYYKMDFEDVVGDLPVRFKYRKVVPNDFGLSVDEILGANDKELNQWCSIKKTCQYRHEDEEKYDVQAFQRKGQNVEVKKKILSSVYAPPKEDSGQNANSEGKDENNKAKRKKRRPKKKKNVAGASENNVKESTNVEADKESSPSKEDNQPQESSIDVNKKSKKKQKKNAELETSNLSQNLNLTATEHDDMDIDQVKDVSLNFEKDAGKVDGKSPKKSKKKRKRTTSEGFEISDLEDSKTDNIPNVYQLNSSPKKDMNKSNDKEKRNMNDFGENNLDSVNVKKRKYNEQEKDNSTPNPKSNEVVKVGSNLSTGETLNTSKANKRSRKKRKNKNGQGSSSKKPFTQNFNAKNFPSNFKTQNPDAEKKLAIPNSRLASYGLNPKKFKNSIIYSK